MIELATTKFAFSLFVNTLYVDQDKIKEY